MLPKALKSCPKSNKLPNLVTLIRGTRALYLVQDTDLYDLEYGTYYSFFTPKNVLNESRFDLTKLSFKRSQVNFFTLQIFGSNNFIKNGQPGPFFVCFCLFKQTIQFLKQINVKKCPNVHPVYSTGIRTHDLHNVSLPP